MDVAGPFEVLHHANDVARKPIYAVQIVSPKGDAVPTRHGMILGATRSLADAAKDRLPNTLIVAGATPTEPLPKAERTVADWLAANHKRCPRIVSICTGAFVLGAAGLLDGRRAVTHWKFLELLKTRFPTAKLDGDEIYVRDGRVWTSAGISAGIDLTLALVEEDAGHAVAFSVARNLVLFLRRSGGQGQFSEILRRQGSETPALRTLHEFILAHIDQNLSVDRLAEKANMSRRTLTRWLRRDLQTSPSEFVRQMRIDEARRLLVETDWGLSTVATRAGFGSETSLWRAFQNSLHLSPAEYRRRFAREEG